MSPKPDLPKIIEQLFARRTDKPLVAGHALFKKTTPPSSSTVSPATAAPLLTSKPASGMWLTKLLGSLRSLGGGRSKAVVGIDVGASAIKLVRVDHGEQEAKVVGVACEEYPPHAEAKAQQEFLLGRLQDFKRRGLLDGRLVLGFADYRAMFELVMIPKMPLADLGPAVIWEAKERLSADPAAHSTRYLIVGENAANGQAQLEILVIAAPKADIVSQWSTFTEYGAKVVAVEPDILASVAACESAGLWTPKDFIGVLEIGRRSSTLALVLDGTVRFVRTFPVAGDSITQSIVDYCETSFDEAEAQKREIGLSQMALEEDRRMTGMEEEPRVKISHALGLYLERLSAEVDHSLRYFTYELAQAKDRKPECLYLLGGGSMLKNLSPFLASRLNTRVEVKDPFERRPISREAREQLQTCTHGARMAAALGLALRPLAN